METRLLSENERTAAKSLWKIAFNDSDCFIDTYFKNRVKPGNSPAIFDNGKLVCVLHLVPYVIDIRGKAFDTAYIVGAATHPDYRKQGLMATLLKESLKILKERGIGVTHLYPFLHAFYERFGWAIFTDMAHCGVKTLEGQAGYAYTQTADFHDMTRLYQDTMKKYTGFCIRGEKEFSMRIEEAACDGAKTALAYLNGGLKAYAMYEIKQNAVQVFETVFENQEALQALLLDICREEGDKEIALSCPPYVGIKNSIQREVTPYGMARIVNIETLLKLLPLKNSSFVLEIKDGFAPWNDGLFEVCYHRGAGLVKRTQKKAHAAMDISAFAQFVHGYAGIDTLIQNGRVKIFDESVRLLFQSLFPAKRTFLFEAY